MLRTYSRKPPECRFIDGVMQLCRLCLGKAGETVQIFNDTDGICSSLALRIMFCVGLEINREDPLPNIVCMDCYKKLERYYAFRKRCEASNQKLKSHLLAVHTRQALEAIALENDVTKNIDINQDENMNVSDLGLIIEEENYSKALEVEPEFVVNNVCSITTESTDKIAENEVIQEIHHTIEPEELSSLISSVLVELGILTQQDDRLSLTNEEMVRIQLETGDDSIIRMELVEEDEEDETQLCVEFAPKVEEEAIEAAADPASAPEDTITEPEPVGSRKASKGLCCGACGRACGSRSSLRRHARTHSGERPFACQVCARAFSQKEVMRRHMLVHDEERPHKCTSCTKSFTQRNSLVLHQRSHLQPHERALALHKCPHCPKLFLYASGLSRHMTAHSGRVFECGACQRQFADKSSVLRHVRHARHDRHDRPDRHADRERTGS